jgi:hypothetical protein
MKRTSLLLLPCILCITSTTTFSQTEIKNQKTMGSGREDQLAGIVLTKDGGFLIGGHSYSGEHRDRNDFNRGYSDYWIIKLNSKGKTEWNKAYGGTRTDKLTFMQSTKDAGYILAGYSISGAYYEKSEESKGLLDYWIIKIDSTGNIQWDKTIGGSLSDYCYAVYQTNDGSYMLGGYSESDASFDKTENARGQAFIPDYWLVKIDSTGNVL